MLENAWVIPALPVLSFFLILFFGRRLPKDGHEIGVGAVAVAFVLASVCVVQWVQRPADLEVKAKSEEHSAAVVPLPERASAEEPVKGGGAPQGPEAERHEPKADEHEKEGGGHEE